MLASRNCNPNFVWSKTYESQRKGDKNEGNSENDKVSTSSLCSEYSEPVDTENNPIYATIRESTHNKPPVPRSSRIPLKDISNSINLNKKDVSKNRSKSLSAFINRKIFSRKILGNR